MVNPRIFERLVRAGMSGGRHAARAESFLATHSDDFTALVRTHGDDLANIRSADDLDNFLKSNPEITGRFREGLVANRELLVQSLRQADDASRVITDFARHRQGSESIADYMNRNSGRYADLDRTSLGYIQANSDELTQAAISARRADRASEAWGTARGAASTVADGAGKAFRAVRSGFMRQNIQTGRYEFSILRTGLTTGGLLAVNGITNGAVSDTGRFLVTSELSPLTFIGKQSLDGAGEVYETIAGEPLNQDVLNGDWVNEVDAYDPNRDGTILMGENGILMSPEDYREEYQRFSNDPETAEAMGTVMTPERYEELQPDLQEAHDSNPDTRPARERAADDIANRTENAVDGATAAASGAAATAGAAASDALDAAGGGLDRIKNMLSGIFDEASGAGLMAAAGAALGFATGGGIKGALGYGILGGFIGMMFPDIGQRISGAFNDNANPEAEQAPAATAAADPAAVGTSASGSDMSQQYASAQAGVAATGQDNDAVTPAEQDLRNNGQAIGAGTSPAPQEQPVAVARPPGPERSLAMGPS